MFAIRLKTRLSCCIRLAASYWLAVHTGLAWFDRVKEQTLRASARCCSHQLGFNYKSYQIAVSTVLGPANAIRAVPTAIYSLSLDEKTSLTQYLWMRFIGWSVRMCVRYCVWFAGKAVAILCMNKNPYGSRVLSGGKWLWRFVQKMHRAREKKRINWKPGNDSTKRSDWIGSTFTHLLTHTRHCRTPDQWAQKYFIHENHEIRAYKHLFFFSVIFVLLCVIPHFFLLIALEEFHRVFFLFWLLMLAVTSTMYTYFW